MPFVYTRTIRFQETDAAGVVYFANVLAMCHEAYEESLIVSRINLQSFFRDPSVAIPIVHASVDFLRPMFCGDQQTIHLKPEPLTNYEFEIAYQVFKTSSPRSQQSSKQAVAESQLTPTSSVSAAEKPGILANDQFSSDSATTEGVSSQLVGKAITRHVCIDPASRTRKELPAEMIRWLRQWSEPSDHGLR